MVRDEINTVGDLIAELKQFKPDDLIRVSTDAHHPLMLGKREIEKVVGTMTPATGIVTVRLIIENES